MAESPEEKLERLKKLTAKLKAKSAETAAVGEAAAKSAPKKKSSKKKSAAAPDETPASTAGISETVEEATEAAVEKPAEEPAGKKTSKPKAKAEAPPDWPAAAPFENIVDTARAKNSGLGLTGDKTLAYFTNPPPRGFGFTPAHIQQMKEAGILSAENAEGRMKFSAGFIAYAKGKEAGARSRKKATTEAAPEGPKVDATVEAKPEAPASKSAAAGKAGGFDAAKLAGSTAPPPKPSGWNAAKLASASIPLAGTAKPPAPGIRGAWGKLPTAGKWGVGGAGAVAGLMLLNALMGGDDEPESMAQPQQPNMDWLMQLMAERRMQHEAAMQERAMLRQEQRQAAGQHFGPPRPMGQGW